MLDDYEIGIINDLLDCYKNDLNILSKIINKSILNEYRVKTLRYKEYSKIVSADMYWAYPNPEAVFKYIVNYRRKWEYNTVEVGFKGNSEIKDYILFYNRGRRKKEYCINKFNGNNSIAVECGISKEKIIRTPTQEFKGFTEIKLINGKPIERNITNWGDFINRY